LSPRLDIDGNLPVTYRAVPLNCSFRPFPFEDATIVARLVTCGSTNRLAKI
jgi:hypothetical protein